MLYYVRDFRSATAPFCSPGGAYSRRCPSYWQCPFKEPAAGPVGPPDPCHYDRYTARASAFADQALHDAISASTVTVCPTRVLTTYQEMLSLMRIMSTRVRSKT